MNSIVLSVALGVVTLSLCVAAVTLFFRLRELRSRYSSITDAEAEAQRLRTDAEREAERVKGAAVEASDKLKAEVSAQQNRRDTLAGENSRLTGEQSRLAKEVSVLEENLEDISFGVYKPHFDFDTPEEYKSALEEVINRQREMIRSGTAARFAVEWTVGGSKKEGERMQRQYCKLLLRAFNGECEAAIAKVSWNNASKMEERIQKAFEAINSLGSVMHVSIDEPYMKLKLNELRLEHELEEKKHAVLEEQRRIREEMREHERAQRELEVQKIDAEKEEAQFVEALERARVDVARAQGEEHTRLTSRILELEEELKGARQKRERVSALGELTRAGYVYVLSNIGSLGENIFKIGMTRRYDPTDRVKELSDASVPFGFDVHAMVYSEDAPALEKAFHDRFTDRNVNPMNLRKEFFKVSIDELQTFAAERGLKIAFTRLPEAREYRETMARRREKAESVPASESGSTPLMLPTISSNG
jgi:Domain of unknown function (DUF4041)/Meiotically up-regulated gene 113